MNVIDLNELIKRTKKARQRPAEAGHKRATYFFFPATHAPRRPAVPAGKPSFPNPLRLGGGDNQRVMSVAAGHGLSFF